MSNIVAFNVFYDTYAPKLWALILLANLLIEQSETMLCNTLTKGWKRFNQEELTERQALRMLISLAYNEDLPPTCLNVIFKHKL